MSASSDIEQAALRLRQAYEQGPVAPLRDVVDPTDADTAYAIAAANTQYWVQQGRQVSGFKVGLTAAAVQQQLGVDQPDFGVLFQDMCIADGGTLDMRNLVAPRAEAEIALILKHDIISDNVTAEDVVAATGAVAPAIEIVDSRIADWRITFADTVADNGSSSHYVLGKPVSDISGLDLYSCGMVLEADGAVVSLGAGAACLGHPMNAAAWLAQCLIGRGQPLRAGQVILTGALGPMFDLKPGVHMRAIIGGVGEVSFDCGAIQ